jgi:3-dehydroquinate dehydratase/shikimate dehydrogenase
MRGVVHSVFEKTPEAAARRLDEMPPECAAAELRADALRAADVAGIVRRAGRPVIATVRATEGGGAFDGSAEEKRAILTAALSSGAAFVDVEWDGPLRNLAFASQAGRVILSHHGARCDAASLFALLDEMAEAKAARLKIVPRAARLAEVPAIRDVLSRARTMKRELCAFASGSAGLLSRIAALAWGSWGTYGAAGRPAGEGQPQTEDLLAVYRVHAIGEGTTVYGLCGSPVMASPSPAMHAAAYRDTGVDAIYVPLESDDLDDVAALAAEGGVFPFAGLGVTIPLKEHVAKRCVRLDPFAACGAANTVVFEEDGWSGFNTDAPAAVTLIRKRLDPENRHVAILGAGGTARAVAAALVASGAFVTMYCRNRESGEAAAEATGADAAPWEDLFGAPWEILVNATPAGRNGEEILLRRHLNGSMVLDAAYGADPTPLVRAAGARGLAVADGFDLLQEQAALQFTRLTGHEAPRGAMSAALSAWREKPRA